MSDELLDDQPAKRSGGQVRLLVLGLLAAGLVAFIVQNTDSTPVTWLVFERSAPLWVLIIVSAAAGAALSEAAGWMLRRRKRRNT